MPSILDFQDSQQKNSNDIDVKLNCCSVVSPCFSWCFQNPLESLPCA